MTFGRPATTEPTETTVRKTTESVDPNRFGRSTVFSIYKKDQVPVQERVARMENRMLSDLRRRAKEMSHHQARFVNNMLPGFNTTEPQPDRSST